MIKLSNLDNERINKDKDKFFNKITPETIDSNDINLLLEFEEQTRRCENFELIFPLRNNFKKFSKFFIVKRYNNYLLWNHLKEPLIKTDCEQN